MLLSRQLKAQLNVSSLCSTIILSVMAIISRAAYMLSIKPVQSVYIRTYVRVNPLTSLYHSNVVMHS